MNNWPKPSGFKLGLMEVLIS